MLILLQTVATVVDDGSDCLKLLAAERRLRAEIDAKAQAAAESARG